MQAVQCDSSCACAEKRAEQASQLGATGARILEIDFLDESSILEAAKQYGSGPLDILINCGGRFALLHYKLWFERKALTRPQPFPLTQRACRIIPRRSS